LTGAPILLAIAVSLIAGLVSRLRGRERRGVRDRSRRAVIADLHDSTSLEAGTGAVRSVQTADLLLDESTLEQIWSATYLERLARTYWRFLTRATLGLVRVRYTEGERSVVLLFSPLKLLTFHAPEYEMEPTRGLVRWRIARGLLVAKRGRNGGGYLQIEVRRERPLEDRPATGPGPLATGPSPTGRPGERLGQAHLHVEVEVANFYPSIASALSRRLYNATQSRIHVIVTRGFLRSLARGDLAESRVGRFAG
jgi:hypothetical protein